MSVVEQYIELLVQMGVPREDAVRFIAYHTENLNIWNKYKAEAERLLELGATRLGSKAIFENLRTDLTLQTNGEFKVSNDFTPHYARIFAIKFPQHKDKFVFKSCKKSEVVQGQVRFSY